MANNQAKSILIFSTAYLPLIGGAEVAVDEITKRLPDWQFDLITAKIKPGLKKEERINNVNIYRIGWGNQLDKFLLPISGLLKARKLDKEKKYGIIWSIMASQAGVAAVFFKFLRSKKKLLLTLQEGDPEEYLERYVGRVGILYRIFIKPWHLLPLKKADYLTVISNYLKKRALRNGVKVPIKIVPNGADLRMFQYRDEIASFSHYLFKKELGIKLGDERVILTVSRLVKKNGVDDLIKAGQHLDFSFKILVVGSGPDENKLKELAKKINLKDKIVFCGFVQHKDLFKYYYVADVFVRPSLSEGLGNSFLEAMAVGLPIIGTPVGGILDFLKDRETGLFCQVRNPKSVAQKIKEILENEPLRKTLAKNGLKLVQKKYNWDNIALKMEEVFKKMSS